MKDPLAARYALKGAKWIAIPFAVLSVIQYLTSRWAAGKTGIPPQMDTANFIVDKLIALIAYAAITYWVVYAVMKFSLYLSSGKPNKK